MKMGEGSMQLAKRRLSFKMRFQTSGIMRAGKKAVWQNLAISLDSPLRGLKRRLRNC